MGEVIRTETRETIGGEREQRHLYFEVGMQAVGAGLATVAEVAAACETGRIPMEWLELLAEVPSDRT